MGPFRKIAGDPVKAAIVKPIEVKLADKERVVYNVKSSAHVQEADTSHIILLKRVQPPIIHLKQGCGGVVVHSVCMVIRMYKELLCMGDRATLLRSTGVIIKNIKNKYVLVLGKFVGIFSDIDVKLVLSDF